MWVKTWTIWVYATRLFTFFLSFFPPLFLREGRDVTRSKLLSYAHSFHSSSFSKKPPVVCLTFCALEPHFFDLHWQCPQSDNVQSHLSVYTSPPLISHQFLMTVVLRRPVNLYHAGFDVFMAWLCVRMFFLSLFLFCCCLWILSRVVVSLFLNA